MKFQDGINQALNKLEEVRSIKDIPNDVDTLKKRIETRNEKSENMKARVIRQRDHQQTIEKNIQKNEALIERWNRQNQRDQEKIDLLNAQNQK